VTTPDDDAPAGELTVRLEIEGGIGAFPGLSRPVELTTRTLDPAGGRHLRVLVAQAFGAGEHTVAPPDAPPSAPDAPPPAGAADVRTYTLTVIADGVAPRWLRVRDPVPDGPLGALIGKLQERRRAGA
jgi:hypothetical protein